MQEHRDAADPARTRAARGRPDLAKGLRVARAVAVTSGGPLALAAASALAPVAVLRRWPSRIETPLARRAAWVATGAALVLTPLYVSVVRPWLMTWGSTASERARTFPGDDPAGPEPAVRTTRAVSVEAPADKVWPWVAQIGQQRGGFYSYDWLENLAGCRIHSADRVHTEWQDVHPGTPIGMTPDLSTEVEAVDPGRALVIKDWGTYVVEPAGEGRSRLIARSHVDPVSRRSPMPSRSSFRMRSWSAACCSASSSARKPPPPPGRGTHARRSAEPHPPDNAGRDASDRTRHARD